MLDAIAARLNAPVMGGDIVYGGFSPAAGFRLDLADGRKIFAKGSWPGELSHGSENLRQEDRIYRQMPADLLSVTPRYHGTAALGDDSAPENIWMLGLWDYLTPDAASPEDSAGALWHAREKIAAARPAGWPEATEKPYMAAFFKDEKKWRRIAGDPQRLQNFVALFDDADKACDWCARHLPQLVRLQAEDLSGLARGALHGDLRVDNMILSGGRIYVADWPNAAIGPLLFDDVFLGCSLRGLAGGALPDVAASPQAQARMLAHVTGYFADQAWRPVPQRLPRLRWMQRGMLAAGIEWLERLGFVDSFPRMRA